MGKSRRVTRRMYMLDSPSDYILESDPGEVAHFVEGPFEPRLKRPTVVDGGRLRDREGNPLPEWVKSAEDSGPRRAARTHLTVRVDPGAKVYAKFQADQESQRSGTRWTQAMVVRAWLSLGRNAWLDGKRPE